MPKLTFLESLFVSLPDRFLHNAQAEELDELNADRFRQAASLHSLADALRRLQADSTRGMIRLQATLAVLSEVVIEQGCDPERLATRIKDAIADAERPQPVEAQGPGGPYRGGANAPAGQKARPQGELCRQCYDTVEGAAPGANVLCKRCQATP